MQNNSLLECLSIYTIRYHTPFSVDSLSEGIPIKNGEKTPKLFNPNDYEPIFERVASRAGLEAKLIERKLNEISSLTLPAILILKDNEACILEEINNNEAKVITSDISKSGKWINLNNLKKQYLGFAFLLTKQEDFAEKEKILISKNDKHWFWDTLWLSKSIYVDVLKASLIINLFVLASPLFTMNVYDRVVPNSAIETMWVLAIGVLVVYLFDTMLKFLRTYFLEIAAKKSDVIMSSKIFEQIMNFKMSDAPKSVGSFASNIRDFDSIRSFLTSSTISLIIDLPFAIIFLIVIYYIGGGIVWIPIILITIILIYTMIVKNPLQKSIEATYQASAYKNSILIESLNTLESLKALGATGYAQYKWEEASGDIAKKSIKSKLLSTSITTITAFFIQISTVLTVIYGVYLIADLKLTMGGLIAIIIISSRTISPIGQVASLISSYEQTKTAFVAIDEIMKKQIERPKGKKFIQRNILKGNIEFRDVTFTYPNSDTPALKNVSFEIGAGEKIAILGKMGSGKTSIFNLLMGFYEPEEGTILVDGIDIKQLDPQFIRKNCSFVPQNVVLFAGSLRENIVQKAPYATDEMIINSTKLSGLDTFINSQPKGFDLYVGERGDTLSGGQKRAVAISRAFLLDLPLAIMDEPTDSMDLASERVVTNNLKNILAKKTLLLTTHKNTMLALVNRVIVIDNSKLIFDGKKEDMFRELENGK